jgi:hypothetical protein
MSTSFKKEYVIDSIHVDVLVLESSITTVTTLKSYVILNKITPTSVTPSWRLVQDGVTVTRDLSF